MRAALVWIALFVAAGTDGSELPVDRAVDAIVSSLPQQWVVAERKPGEIPRGHHWCDTYQGVKGVRLIAVGPRPVSAQLLDQATGNWISQPMASEALEIWVMPRAYRDSRLAALCTKGPVQAERLWGGRTVTVWAIPAHSLKSEAEFKAALSQARGIQWPESPANGGSQISWATWKQDLVATLKQVSGEVLPPNTIVSITTHAPGMPAELVESAVTNPIEKALMDVSSISRVRSMSAQGKSYVEVSVRGVSAEVALPAVRAALARQQTGLPAALAAPVLKVEPARLGSAP